MMRYIIGVVLILSFLWVFGNASQGTPSDSIEPMYVNAAGLDMMSDAPWVVKCDEPIPFFFIIKDCDQYTLVEFHALAIYDISNVIKCYSNGTRLNPSLNDTTRGFWFQD